MLDGNDLEVIALVTRANVPADLLELLGQTGAWVEDGPFNRQRIDVRGDGDTGMEQEFSRIAAQERVAGGNILDHSRPTTSGGNELDVVEVDHLPWQR